MNFKPSDMLVIESMAESVPSERNHCWSGATFSEGRRYLSREDLKQLVFPKANLRHFQ